MPKVSEEHLSARRAEIIDAALRCFRRSGYQGTSMADIIAESGLSAGAIYSYFESKRQLLIAAAEQIMSRNRVKIEATHSGAGLTSIAEQIIEIAVDTDVKEIGIQLWSEATTDPEIRVIVNNVVRQLREAIIAALTQWANDHPDSKRGDSKKWAKSVAPVLMSITQGGMLQSVLLDDFDSKAYLRGIRYALGE